MAGYQISFTDALNKGTITVEENSTNSETSLTFVGRNLSDYGKIVNENFLQLLENFANDTPPRNPVEGQTWYDTTQGIDQLKIYDGAQWVSAGGLNKSSSRPADEISTVGDLWVDTSNQQLYLYSGSGWILVGPDYSQGSSSGTRFENIISTGNLENPVVTTYVNNVPVAIISASEFTPKTTIAGFSKIFRGINVSSIGKIYGRAEKAEGLIVGSTVYPGSEFARLSANNIFEQAVRVRNNNGLGIGETETLRVSISGSNVLLSNKSNDGYISLLVNNDTTAIRASFDGKVGILNESPQEALDVRGNIKASGKIVGQDVVDSADISDGALIIAGGAGIAKNLNVGGNLNVQSDITAHNITPVSGTSPNVGSTTLPYNEIHATTYFGQTFRGDFIGNVSGTASSAAKLNSSTVFNITGDVSSTADISFDGATGGLTKTFTTQLNDTFFTGKPEYTDNISRTEQILIFKTAQGVGDTLSENNFYTASVEKIVSTVPTFAVGMVMPYAGTVAPTGWLICDGRPLVRSQYEALFDVIGTLYGSPNQLEFYIPDLRGRFPLGYLGSASRTQGSDEDRVYDDAAAAILGADGGTQRKWITKDNLPEHEHLLVDDNGNTYFALTNQTGIGESVNLTGSSPGSGTPSTGGLQDVQTSLETIPGYSQQQQVGEKMSIVPPFVTMNYIIYTGV